ncbi:MAG: VOC family protein [Alphaproteobacteria bacterium]|nr:VOC family protein [Alphaproteobacteria bacterium]
MTANINPYLNFDGQASEALDFYTSALGGEVEGVMRWKDMPGQEVPPQLADNIMHACLKVGDGRIMLSDLPPHMKVAAGNQAHVMLELTEPDDVDRIFAALSEGGEVKMPVENTFWNARYGHLIDRFGVSWMLNCSLGG